jgi:phosphatidylglycerophosphatase GEP4
LFLFQLSSKNTIYLKMVQSINFPAWVITPRIILFERHLLQPHFKVKDIRNINFQELKRIGCKAVIFDKDNCLMRPYELEIFPNLRV